MSSIDSPLATRIEDSLGFRKGVYSPRNAYEGIIVHTTGAGPIRRFESNPKKYKSEFEAALYIYSRIMKAGPHYVVSQQGQIAQLCPEELAAWHTGASYGARYNSKSWLRNKRYAWWAERWPGLKSPKDLAGGNLWRRYERSYGWKLWYQSRNGSVNANTVGIEVVPPSSNPRGHWSHKCWRALVRLVENIAHRRSIPLHPDRILSHSDANPISRTTRSGRPWDTPPTQFSWSHFTKYRNIYCGSTSVDA